MNENHIMTQYRDFANMKSDLKRIIKELPPMRWNIAERDESNPDFPYGYFGDEWDNWEHMTEEERAEYFGKIFSTVKKLKDIIDSY